MLGSAAMRWKDTAILTLLSPVNIVDFFPLLPLLLYPRRLLVQILPNSTKFLRALNIKILVFWSIVFHYERLLQKKKEKIV